ncbi:hypothetical protein AAFF_G00277520 [Aldrovandia affinis]|uniref:C-type lectin domain-containing protein n=1 Tax=Aldrovandia affinis TaxID=143900 RepID=A0AAD7RA58_9TELE|nr:hypothetical protein AAFF_G00277520 [Aldrovandia affinis]
MEHSVYLLLLFSAWSRLCHARKLDPNLNETCRIVTGCIKTTPVHCLYALSDIRRAVSTKQANDNRRSLHEHSAARKRLSSRSSFPDTTEVLETTPTDARITEWQNQWNSLGSQTTQWMERGITQDECLATGQDQPWAVWKTLNRLRVGEGRCKYHFVNMRMSWTEAQSYCREHHTDLATVDNPEEMKRMMGVVGSDYVDKGAWIGLERKWQWSLTDRGFYSEGETEFRNWDEGQPDNEGGNESCAGMRHSGMWNDVACDYKKSFICYDDNLILVRENKSWDEALSFCRQQHGDLVSVPTEQVQHWVNRRAQRASTAHMWLGLRFSCAMKFWLWLDGEITWYQNWAQGNDTGECGHRGAVESGAGQQWVSLPKTEELNFICSKCVGESGATP